VLRAPRSFRLSRKLDPNSPPSVNLRKCATLESIMSDTLRAIGPWSYLLGNQFWTNSIVANREHLSKHRADEGKVPCTFPVDARMTNMYCGKGGECLRNFCKPVAQVLVVPVTTRKALRCALAMAAGVPDRIWSLDCY
jgi:hypothetical protein